MSVKSKIKQFIINFYDRNLIYRNTNSEINYYKSKKGNKNIDASLTKKEKLLVNEFFKKNYGKKIDCIFHKVYKSYSGKFDYRYFPQSLFEPRLSHFLNSRKDFKGTISDKSFLPIVAYRADIKMVENILINTRDMFFDKNFNIVSFDEAVNILRVESGIIVKPSTNSSGGQGVKVFDKKEGYNSLDENVLKYILSEYKTDFVVQKLLKNHESIAKIYPNSLNTIRIVTYIMNGKIEHTNAILRLGVGKARFDNATAGGIFVGVREDGSLINFAMDKYGNRTNKHPTTGFIFKGSKIKELSGIIDAAKKMHRHVPQLGIIDWDFTIDENGEPVLVEANIGNCGGVRLIQFAHGEALFGENTAEILQWIKENEKLSKSERDKLKIHL